MIFDFQTPSLTMGVIVFPDTVFEPQPREAPIIDSQVIVATPAQALSITASADQQPPNSP